MAASISAGRKVTPPATQLLGVEPNPTTSLGADTRTGLPNHSGASGAEGQSKTSAGTLGRAGVPNLLG